MGLYKTELIRRQGPWRNVEAIEMATLGWVDNRRLLGPIGHVPPAEFEAAYYQKKQAQAMVPRLAQISLRKTRGGSQGLHQPAHCTVPSSLLGCRPRSSCRPCRIESSW